MFLKLIFLKSTSYLNHYCPIKKFIRIDEEISHYVRNDNGLFRLRRCVRGRLRRPLTHLPVKPREPRHFDQREKPHVFTGQYFLIHFIYFDLQQFEPALINLL
jgi:hypothetical protein